MKFIIMILSILPLLSCHKDNGGVEPNPPPQIKGTLNMIVGSTTFTASLCDNAAAIAFQSLLPLTLNMNEMNHNEKYATLPGLLPVVASNHGTIQNGDIMLYGSNTLVLFYRTFSSSYLYTSIARVDNPLKLQEALGKGSVMVTIEQN